MRVYDTGVSAPREEEDEARMGCAYCGRGLARDGEAGDDTGFSAVLRPRSIISAGVEYPLCVCFFVVTDCGELFARGNSKEGLEKLTGRVKSKVLGPGSSLEM